jgi:hypothetical protein
MLSLGSHGPAQLRQPGTHVALDRAFRAQELDSNLAVGQAVKKCEDDRLTNGRR